MAFLGMTPAVLVDDTIAKIVAASTVAGARVYKSRTRSWTVAELPCVEVELRAGADEWIDWSGGTSCSVYALRSSTLIVDCVAERKVSESDDGNDADNDLADDLSAFATAVVESLWGDEAWRKGTGRTTVGAEFRPLHDVGPIRYEYAIGQEGGRRVGACRVTIPCDHLVQFGGTA